MCLTLTVTRDPCECDQCEEAYYHRHEAIRKVDEGPTRGAAYPDVLRMLGGGRDWR